jgi:hypothetical protein
MPNKWWEQTQEQRKQDAFNETQFTIAIIFLLIILFASLWL